MLTMVLIWFEFKLNCFSFFITWWGSIDTELILLKPERRESFETKKRSSISIPNESCSNCISPSTVFMVKFSIWLEFRNSRFRFFKLEKTSFDTDLIWLVPKWGDTRFKKIRNNHFGPLCLFLPSYSCVTANYFDNVKFFHHHSRAGTLTEHLLKIRSFKSIRFWKVSAPVCSIKFLSRNSRLRFRKYWKRCAITLILLSPVRIRSGE